MSQDQALAMEPVGPELYEELHKLFNGYMKHCFWGPKKCYLLENYKTMAEDVYRMPLRADDIFVVSFQRSGTTWTQELVWLVANDINIDKAKSIPLVNRYTFLEQSMLIDEADTKGLKQHVMLTNPKANLENFDLMTTTGPKLMAGKESPRFVKTHLPLSLLPPNLLNETKVVYIARDPRDVVVSYYHFLKNLSRNEYVGDLKQLVDLLIRGLVKWCPMLEHLKEAWQQRHNNNLLFIFYEDLCKDPHGVVKKIAEFLGKHFTDDQIAQIVEYTSFDNFKKNESVDAASFYKEVGFFKNEAVFIRKGKTGGWREIMDAETKEKMNRWMTENLKDTDLVFPST